MKQRTHRQSGFTLVELSIVLVVVGLLLGSVLVAIGIIKNARASSVVTTFQAIQAAVSTYNQNFGALPGDDKAAASHFTSVTVSNGGGNGVIGTSTLTKTFDTSSSAGGDGEGESGLVWSHLRAAGLIKGDATSTAQPSNPFGGVFGIQNGAFAVKGIALGTNVVCAGGIPGASAQVIDQRLDDGDATTGSMRGGTDITGDATAYAETGSYIICTGL